MDLDFGEAGKYGDLLPDCEEEAESLYEFAKLSNSDWDGKSAPSLVLLRAWDRWLKKDQQGGSNE